MSTEQYLAQLRAEQTSIEFFSFDQNNATERAVQSSFFRSLALQHKLPVEFLALDHPVQQRWRDVEVAHQSLDVDQRRRGLGKRRGALAHSAASRPAAS